MAASDFQILDERFARLPCTTATIHKLFDQSDWAEGPAYFPAGRYLVWSDAPNNRMLRYDESNGVVSVFRQPANHANGNTVDRQGRLVTCEHGTRRVTRTEHDGTITVLTDNYRGQRLNSPNDVVVKSDGTIWFTDPTYGIDSDYEGYRAASEIGASNVYRLDPDTGSLTIVCDDFVQPNGLAFSPDERLLYVADTGRTHGLNNPAHMRVFDVDSVGKLANSRVFADCSNGLFDGFRLDAQGRVWSSASDGVHVYDTDGTLIGKILIPEVVANLSFGGLRRERLFICATTGLYSVRLFVNGAITF